MRLLFAIVLLSAAALGQVQGVAGDQPGGPPLPQTNRAVEWIKLEPPEYPLKARQARMQGTAKIRVTFYHCALQPETIRVVSGEPILAASAVASLRQSQIGCGDFASSSVVLEYHFILSKCGNRQPKVSAAGYEVQIRACSP